MTLNSRTFRARTVRVQTSNRIEVDMDLDFGLRAKRTFLIDGFPPSVVPEERRADAKHCLVVLVGGKNLIVRPDAKLRDKWHLLQDLHAKVYLRGRVAGAPIGYIPNGVPESAGPVLEIGPFMRWIAETCDFNVDRVKSALNGVGDD